MTLAKVLIANRGEIAVRVARACRDAGIASVAVYADPDRDAPHVRAADEAFALGGDTPAASYLDIGKILAAAAKSGADAVHPGYGFLSENADFAQAVLDAGLTWIGPPPQAIRDLGDKVAARKIAQRAGAPLVGRHPRPGLRRGRGRSRSPRSTACPSRSRRRSAAAGAASRSPARMEEIPELYESAVREAVAAFGRGECFVERYLDRPRHVETQCLADAHGNVVVVSTRDCSLQRRHQKLVEEAPAPYLTSEQDALLRAASKDDPPGGRLRRRRHLRVPHRPGRHRLLPRGQHPAAGRAPGHRGGHRHRPGPGDVPHRRRRAARLRRPGRRAATRSSSVSTPRTPAAASCPRPAPSPPGSRPPGPASGSTRASGRLGDRPRLGLAARQAHRHRRHPRAGAAARRAGPGRVRGRPGSPPPCRSTGPSSPTRPSRPNCMATRGAVHRAHPVDRDRVPQRPRPLDPRRHRDGRGEAGRAVRAGPMAGRPSSSRSTASASRSPSPLLWPSGHPRQAPPLPCPDPGGAPAPAGAVSRAPAPRVTP